MTIAQGKVDIFVNILHQVASILSGSGFHAADKLAGLVGYASFMVKEAGDSTAELQNTFDYIQTLASEGRVPTDEEWSEWDAELRTIDERLARVKRGIEPSDNPPDRTP